MEFYRARTVLLTGASSGIGEAMARLLAPHRPHLLLVARSQEALDALAADCRAQGARAEVYAQDLAVPGAAQTLFDRLTADGHTVDVLINNAGFGKQGRVLDHAPEIYEEMLTLNVTNLTLLTRLALPPLVEHGEGGILNVASTAAFVSTPYLNVYAASKAYILSFTEALHDELRGSGIHVTALAPGPTQTAFADRAGMARFTGGIIEAPEKVARVGLEALALNRRTAVSGGLNRVATLLAELAPRRLGSRVAGRLMRRVGREAVPEGA